MKIGQHLFTKDGRTVGNGIIVAIEESSMGGKLYVVETDFGNTGSLSKAEIEAWYHTTKPDGVEQISPVGRYRFDKLLAGIKSELNYQQ